MGPPADLHEEPGAAPTRIGASWQAGAAVGDGMGVWPGRDGAPRSVGAGSEVGSSGAGAAWRTAVAGGEFAAEPGLGGGGAAGQAPAVRAAVLGRAVATLAPRRWGRVLAGGGVAVLLLLGGGVVAYKKMARETRLAGPPPVVVVSPGPSGKMGPAVVLPSPSPSATSGRPAAQHSARTTPGRPAKGTFVLVDDVSDITVRTAELGNGIVKVSVPDGSDARPRTTVDGGAVQLGVRDGGRNTDLDVQLDSRVSWTIRFGGGARRMSVDLSGTNVRSVTFDGGAARIDLRLPALGGTLPIAMNGGVNRWRIVTDGRVGVQLVARRGAGDVELYGRDRGGMDRGDRVSADGRDGIDVNASAGFGSLTVVGA
ncbi:hypothetical protein ACIA5C_07615 [Actinoplanes sp. NPDC051343]|uniref:hypothetical protein n=1 Tax=Actinoplanes sp. NPDC051343 TaxID=3363906 RepID=UPI0037923DDA